MSLTQYETETKYGPIDNWSEWITCPECSSDNVAIVHRKVPGASSGYLWCEDCGRFAGHGPGTEGKYIGEDPAEL